MEVITVTRGEYSITTDKSKLDIEAIHDFLSNQSYWSRNIPLDTVKKSIEHSLNFGLLHVDKQIGYARVISDFSTIAYLGDVYVLPEYRGRGFSKWLMEQVMRHPELQGLRRWILLTSSAHELYKKFGWTEVAKPEIYMELFNPNVYKGRE
ncbi:GNAT family N-acetyltransferase [Chitinophagaceae bacterium LB-8]|uniref:GNAT family N-acetyltransferase n=1 Tax=Paraflavisolibacter caeni TaxID=2982496 RepID=A0A9X3BIA0_9BACT|nr:GNAT family N-acetyltransferase [Paraflavisolibacter caeni]MCU7550987.1 GNAT family N-acetyltransferase [Paraflavisolibacter caeni]